MKLIIIRHAETEENKAGVIQGHLPGKLSAEGIKQAKKVALRLRNEKIDFIFSSDLARAADTAKEITKYHPNTPLKFVKNLRERKLGSLQGKRKNEIKSNIDWKDKNQKEDFIKRSGGETTEEVYNRVKKFLCQIMSGYYKDTVLFVCHGNIGKILIAAITGRKYEDMVVIENLKNTSISIFEIDKDKNYKSICFNCVKHLK